MRSMYAVVLLCICGLTELSAQTVRGLPEYVVSECYGDIFSFDCGPGNKIRINRDFFGFSSNRGSCSHNRGDCIISNPKSNSLVHRYCTGRRECTYYQVERRACDGYYSNYQQVEYQCVPDSLVTDVCANVHYEASSAFIGSPNFPNNYPPNQSCSCLVTSRTPGVRVRLEVVYMAVKYNSPCRDWLKVGRRRMCGTSVDLFSGSRIPIEFHSDGEEGHSGFWLHFHASTSSRTLDIRCGNGTRKQTTTTTTTATTTTATTTTTTTPATTSTTKTRTTNRAHIVRITNKDIPRGVASRMGQDGELENLNTPENSPPNSEGEALHTRTRHSQFSNLRHKENVQSTHQNRFGIDLVSDTDKNPDFGSDARLPGTNKNKLPSDLIVQQHTPHANNQPEVPEILRKPSFVPESVDYKGVDHPTSGVRLWPTSVPPLSLRDQIRPPDIPTSQSKYAIVDSGQYERTLQEAGGKPDEPVHNTGKAPRGMDTEDRIETQHTLTQDTDQPGEKLTPAPHNTHIQQTVLQGTVADRLSDDTHDFKSSYGTSTIERTNSGDEHNSNNLFSVSEWNKDHKTGVDDLDKAMVDAGDSRMPAPTRSGDEVDSQKRPESDTHLDKHHTQDISKALDTQESADRSGVRTNRYTDSVHLPEYGSIQASNKNEYRDSVQSPDNDEYGDSVHLPDNTEIRDSGQAPDNKYGSSVHSADNNGYLDVDHDPKNGKYNDVLGVSHNPEYRESVHIPNSFGNPKSIDASMVRASIVTKYNGIPDTTNHGVPLQTEETDLSKNPAVLQRSPTKLTEDLRRDVTSMPTHRPSGEHDITYMPTQSPSREPTVASNNGAGQLYDHSSWSVRLSTTIVNPTNSRVNYTKHHTPQGNDSHSQTAHAGTDAQGDRFVSSVTRPPKTSSKLDVTTPCPHKPAHHVEPSVSDDSAPVSGEGDTQSREYTITESGSEPHKKSNTPCPTTGSDIVNNTGTTTEKIEEYSELEEKNLVTLGLVILAVCVGIGLVFLFVILVAVYCKRKHQRNEETQTTVCSSRDNIRESPTSNQDGDSARELLTSSISIVGGNGYHKGSGHQTRLTWDSPVVRSTENDKMCQVDLDFPYHNQLLQIQPASRLPLSESENSSLYCTPATCDRSNNKGVQVGQYSSNNNTKPKRGQTIKQTSKTASPMTDQNPDVAPRNVCGIGEQLPNNQDQSVDSCGSRIFYVNPGLNSDSSHMTSEISHVIAGPSHLDTIKQRSMASMPEMSELYIDPENSMMTKIPDFISDDSDWETRSAISI